MNLRICHLLSRPEDEREKRSVEAVSALSENTFGYAYTQCVNLPYDGPIPPARDDNGTRPFKLTSRHYGCWYAHKLALAYLTDDLDCLFVAECDCVFTEPVNKVIARIWKAYIACIAHDLAAFTFGPLHGGELLEQLDGNMATTSRFIETHCYLIPAKARSVWAEMYSKDFDTIDYAISIYLLDQQHERIGIFTDKIVAVQADGMSLLDNRMKDSETHFRNLEGQN